ncbi:MAG: hypothetical protein M3126_01195 [Candidatus Eremiobacteraeota bacterium]|nr:hypothetical protein [Candidatus Eremiobacteraeota bacterium]
MIGAAFTVALAIGPQMQIWMDANARSVARVRSAQQRRSFDATLGNLKVHLRPARGIDAPNAKALALKTLANRRLYTFGAVQQPLPKTWWERATAWVRDRWQAILGALFGRGRALGRTGVFVGDVLLAVSVAVLMLLLARLYSRYGRRSAQPGRVSVIDAGGDPMEFCARAEDLAREGRYSPAVSELFAAALWTLRNAGAVNAQESETLGQLRARVRSHSVDLGSAFEPLATALTYAVYANARTGKAEWERARAAYDLLVQHAGRKHAA